MNRKESTMNKNKFAATPRWAGTATIKKTVMTLWTFFRSPLMVGAELTKLDDWTLSMLQNKGLD